MMVELLADIFSPSTGYANHGDYVFGWQGDALQRALDSPCYQNCPTLKTQNAAAMNQCTVPRVVKEEIDNCKYHQANHNRFIADSI